MALMDVFTHFSIIRRERRGIRPEEIKRVRLIRRADGYYCQFVLSCDVKEDVKPSGKCIGLDVGLASFGSSGFCVETRSILILSSAK